MKTKTIRVWIMGFSAHNGGVLFGFSPYRKGEPFLYPSKNRAMWTPETKEQGVLFDGTPAYETMIAQMETAHYRAFIEEMTKDAEMALRDGGLTPYSRQKGTFTYQEEK